MSYLLVIIYHVQLDICRYRISGSSLLAAMDPSSDVPCTDTVSAQSSDILLPFNEQNQDLSNGSQGQNETVSLISEGSRRLEPTVDVAEVLRCWTHALQRIHKQSLHLVCSYYFQGYAKTVIKFNMVIFRFYFSQKVPTFSCD